MGSPVVPAGTGVSANPPGSRARQARTRLKAVGSPTDTEGTMRTTRARAPHPRATSLVRPLRAALLVACAAAVVAACAPSASQSDGGTKHVSPGRPAASGVAAVVAVAEEAWWAESLAKAALVLGDVGGPALLRRHGAEGVVIGDDTEPVACWRSLSPAGR